MYGCTSVLPLSISASIPMTDCATAGSVKVLPMLSSWEEVVPAQLHMLCLSGQQVVLLQVWGHWYLLPPQLFPPQ